MARLHLQLQPYVPSEADPFDRVKASHLLSRAGFGGTDAEIDRVLSLGPTKAVDELLDFPDTSAKDQDPKDQPDLSAIEDLPKSMKALRQMFRGMSEEERKLAFQRAIVANVRALTECGRWWMHRMATGDYPLQEKLTLFWHGHFATSAKDERSAFLMFKQNELLRQYAAGDFFQFVKSISRDPAMLDYLNNTQNHKRKPNENYARELMELFTLGIGNYSETDIKEAARAFTGWTHDGEDFSFDNDDHDTGTKRFFGKQGTFDGDDVITLICKHPACQEFIAGKLYRFFVSDQLDSAVQNNLGQVFWDAKYKLRPLLRTMLTSRIFYAPATIGAQIKSPVQLVIGTVRKLNLTMPQTGVLAGALNQMGQVPFFPPNVKGWPGGRAWINTSTLFVRQNTAVFLAGGSAPGTGRRFMDRLISAGLDTRFQPKGGASSDKLVDEWVARLMGRPIDSDKRRVLIDSLAGQPSRPENVKNMIQLIVAMPEYQLC